ncbi:ribosome small subunit-dependent GTPase A [Marispirochaeta sp.]|uniref:ribosome small subunit-dependent GTPase A n=1 Tax=Marispirochaeta sp. TaxID=2038653 RepID=UPI0029C8EAB3|nr:ribosome small subunit-dependent GTPase A [Marispirochaeta sp.]
MLLGRVAAGINNIYTLLTTDGEDKNREREVSCRIKGKKLKGDPGRYNPIAVGDWVEFEDDLQHQGSGMIVSRQERKNVFARLNRKRGTMQTIAANMDLLVCLTSPESPPFRPRFIDRVLVAAAIGDMPVMVLVNKMDQHVDNAMRERLDVYSSIGCQVRYCSAATGEGVAEFIACIRGKDTAFVGQSGVGKSTLLNRIVPGADLAVGEITKKYNRGSHTTCFALMLKADFPGRLVDTPGIREIDIAGILPLDLGHYFPEFVPFLGDCAFSPCYHDHEPRCAVRDAVDDGRIHADRFESYLRILEQLRNNAPGYVKERRKN